MSNRGNLKLKLIDRYLGIPLIYLLSFFRFKRHLLNSPQTIGILATAAIGDTILLSALGKSLKISFPNSKIFLFASESNFAVGKMLDGFDEIIFTPVKSPLKAILNLRARHLDVLIDTGQWARINAFLSYFSGAKFTIGFKTPGQLRHFCYDRQIPHSDKLHELQNFLNLAGGQDVISKNDLFPTFRDHTITNKDSNLIICHLKPSGEKAWMKEWDEQKWAKLIDYFTSNNYEVYLTGGPEDKEALDHFQLTCRDSNKVSVVAGKYSLKETMELLKKAKICVSVNTGIMHMAATLGINLVAIHGPTNPKRWGPLNPNSRSVSSILECAPCLNLGFDYKCPMNYCMQSITFESVLSECNYFLISD